MPHATIIGGGIAGMATAWHLQQLAAAAGAALDVTLCEQLPAIGGKLLTEKVDGFTIEGGPDSFITQKPWGLRLCRELGLGEQLLKLNPHPVYLLLHGRLRRYPKGFRLAFPTSVWPMAMAGIFTPWAKLRMACDLLLPARRDPGDESLASFIRRRLGREALDRLAAPLMAGIYVSDAERMSMLGTFPGFVHLERRYGSLTRAMGVLRRQYAAARARPGGFGSPFATPRDGVGALAAALRASLRAELCPGRRVEALRPLPGGGWELRVAGEPAPRRTDAVVLATPAFASAALLAPLDPALGALLETFRYVSTATVSLGFAAAEVRAQTDFDGLGFIIPKAENRRILACTWSSRKFDHRAPPDGVLIRVFVGGGDREHLVDLPDSDLVTLAREELAAIHGLRAEPRVARVYRWPRANPQYDVGHLDRVAEVETRAARLPGLAVTGSAFRGIGIPDCIGAARVAAHAVCAHLGIAAPPDPPDPPAPGVPVG